MKDQTIETKGREPRDILNDLVNAAHSMLSRCLNELLVQAKDWGFRNDPQARNLYLRYDALDAYAAFHDVITVTCLKEAKAGFFTSPNTDESQATLEQDDHWDLQVIEPEEIELAGASEALAKTLSQRFNKSLLYIELRLDYLNHGLDEKINPRGLHPQSLMLAFQQGTNRLSIKLEGKVLLCEFFQQQLHTHLEQFYSQANQILNDSGILDNEKWLENAIFIRNLEAQAPIVPTLDNFIEPVLSSSEQLNFEVGKVSAENACDPFLPEDEIIAEPVAVDAESIDDSFTHLLLAPVAPGTGSMLSSYQRAQIVGALSWVQRERAMSDVPLEQEEIKALITRKLYESGIFNAAELVARETPAMDFVNQIFVAVGGDESLSETVRSLICKLQVPTIKLALLDFEFFKDPKHPARETLNHLTELAVGIMDDKDSLLAQLVAVVKQILKQFDTEVSVFQDALNRLEKLALSEAERIRKNEAFARSSVRHDVSNSITQSTVTQIVKHHLMDRTLPRVATEFIHACWAPLMIAIDHAQGRKSPLWKQSVNGLRRFAEASQQGNLSPEIHRMINQGEDFLAQLSSKYTPTSEAGDSLVTMLAQLRGRLCEISNRINGPQASGQSPSPVLTVDELSADEAVSPAEFQTLFSDDCSLLKESSLNLLYKGTEPFDGMRDRGGDSVPLADGEGLNAQFHRSELPACVKPGTWFEVYQTEGKARRHLKLSAILRESDQLLFANRSGEKELLIDIETFLEDLKKGHSKTIQDSNLFDRALSTVINAIRKSQQDRLQGDN